jgi:hypothetical protein
VGGKQQLRFALAALAAGIVWGYLRSRRNGHALRSGVLLGLEWFVAYGGAAALIDGARRLLEETREEEPVERVTHLRQVVVERTGTEG